MLNTLPGDIPNLIRQWSPLRLQDGNSTVALAIEPNHVEVFARPSNCWANAEVGRLLLARVALDLTDPTGRAHAAWWCNGRFDGHPGDDAWKALSLACAGIEMTPTQIDTLARLVLRLAGRTP